MADPLHCGRVRIVVAHIQRIGGQGGGIVLVQLEQGGLQILRARLLHGIGIGFKLMPARGMRHQWRDKKSWYEFIKNTPENLLLRFKNPHALSSIIRKHLLSVPPAQWYELTDLAQQLNISEATIQRRLKSEGISYQQLKNDIRRDLAIELLTKSTYTLQEISDQLYFQEVSAFHRAFKKWTDVSPGAYRESQNPKN